MTELAIYNIKGQKVKTLENDIRQKGFNSIKWDGRDDNQAPVCTGVYFCRIKVGVTSQTQKMPMVKLRLS